MSVISYTAHERAALISDHVVGDSYSFDITFMRFEKSYNSPKKQHQSIGGVIETVLARTDELISIEIGPYDSADIPQIEEFIKSVSSGEQFQLDLHGTVAVANVPLTVKINDNKNSPTRHGPRTYSLAFNVLANASGASAGGVDPLPPVEEIETPFFGGWFSGEAGCVTAGTKPTWSSGALFVREINATGMSVFIDQYLANNGGSAITSWAVAPGYSLPGPPTTLALNSSTSELTGDSGGITAGDYPVAFIATNTAGFVSEVSPEFILRFFDGTVEVVTITGISATVGSNDVFVDFTDLIRTVAGTPASYEVDFTFRVGSVLRNHSYVGGGVSARLQFSLGGSAFVDGDVITMVYV